MTTATVVELKLNKHLKLIYMFSLMQIKYKGHSEQQIPFKKLKH